MTRYSHISRLAICGIVVAGVLGLSTLPSAATIVCPSGITPLVRTARMCRRRRHPPRDQGQRDQRSEAEGELQRRSVRQAELRLAERVQAAQGSLTHPQATRAISRASFSDPSRRRSAASV